MNNKIEILIINSVSSELKELSEYLVNADYKILFSNQIEAGIQIIEKKKPFITILNIQNQKDFKMVDEFLALNIPLIIRNLTNRQIDKAQNALLRIINDVELNANLIARLCNEMVLSRIDIDIFKTKFQTSNSNKLEFDVLLVEDNDLNQYYYEEILKKSNLKYKTVKSLPMAVNKLNDYGFKIVVSDAIIKDGNGIDLIKHAYNTNHTKIPFVLISGHNKNELENTFGYFNCDVFLEKPITEETFSSTVLSLLQNNTVITQDSKPTKKTYNSEKINTILKNNTEKIEASLKEFQDILSTAIQLISEVQITENFEKLRESMHSLLNLAPYYGADLVVFLIKEFKSSRDHRNKLYLLEKLDAELKNLTVFYSKTETFVI